MTEKSAIDDRQKYWSGITTSMEQASNVGGTCQPYQSIHQVSGKPLTLSDSVRDVNGGFSADNSAKVNRWHEHFEHLVNYDEQLITLSLSSALELHSSPAYAMTCDPLPEENSPILCDSRTRPNQARFRAVRGCADQIFTLRRILEFRHGYQQPSALSNSPLRSTPSIVLLYGCESWAVRAKVWRRLEVFDHRCLRVILRVKYTDYVSNEVVRARWNNIARISQAIKQRKLRWFGHVLGRPPHELSSNALDPAPLPTWRRRRGQLKTWLEMVRQYMEAVLGPSVFGVRRWRNEWAELSTSAAANSHVWRGTIRDIIEADKIRHDRSRKKYKYIVGLVF
ncbi:unnamed protein product [Schistocephalus solidus]|uniref:Uncharacterized protein n=1 Tax=Schistocephalus solidus TaxID=70667 RepID=A0A183T3A3_SCHSO|nr:unnamed protein product [Schistocephalus solidus]